MSREICNWRIVAASVCGTSHLKVGMPCQDAHIVRLLREQGGESVLVIVVSDGAGSAARAEAGAALTCEVIADNVAVYLDRGGVVASISVATAKTWVESVQQGIRTQAEDEGLSSRDYACTMIAVVLSQSAAAIMQIGDGGVVVSTSQGWHCVHWPQHGEYANMTNFVTEDAAVEKVAFSLFQYPIEEIAVFSDGIERLVLHHASKTAFAPFFDQMFPTVRSASENGLNPNLSLNLAQYLESNSVCDRTDDDKTLVLATTHHLEPLSILPNVISEEV